MSGFSVLFPASSCKIKWLISLNLVHILISDWIQWSKPQAISTFHHWKKGRSPVAVRVTPALQHPWQARCRFGLVFRNKAWAPSLPDVQSLVKKTEVNQKSHATCPAKSREHKTEKGKTRVKLILIWNLPHSYALRTRQMIAFFITLIDLTILCEYFKKSTTFSPIIIASYTKKEQALYLLQLNSSQKYLDWICM